MKTFSRSPGSTPQILLPLIESAGFWLAMVALWLVAVEATAATKTWDGSSSGNWGTAANWTGGVAPAPGDDLVFPAGVSRFNVTNNMGLLPLRSLTFTGSNYVLRGVGIILTNGITAGHASKTNTIELDISINASQTFTATSGGVLEIFGDLALNGASLTISNSSNTRLDGVISGSGGLTKSGAGTLTLSGTNANTFTGTTTVNAGLLALDKNVNNGAIPANMTIGSLSSATVRHLRTDQIANGAVVTVQVNGVLDLNGLTDIIGGLTLTSGLAESGTGAIRLNGNLTVNASATPANITGELELFGTALRAFSVSSGTASPDVVISAQITGGGGFIKSGGGEVELAGSNSYSGLTMINAGSVRVSHTSGLGSAAVGTVLNGGDLFVEGVTIASESLTNSSLSVLHGSTTLASVWSGNIVLNTNLTISTSSNALLNLSGTISGSGGISKAGLGPLRFSGSAANTYAGATTVRGTLELGKTSPITSLPGALSIGDGSPNVNRDVVRLLDGNQMAATSDVVINTSGLLDLNSHLDGLGSISGQGNITLGSGTLGVSSASGTNVFSGSISDTGGLTKSGAAKLILSGTNSYSGLTIVAAGTLQVDGAQPNSAIQVNGGARLQGTGIVGSISSSGNAFVIAPGDSPGLLTCSNLTGGGTGQLEVELGGTTPGAGYDQINARGTVQLTGLNLNLALGFASSLSNQFIIIKNGGTNPISGTFSSKPEGSTVSAGGESFRISYLGGDGNDVVLTQISGVFRPTLNIERAATNSVRLFWSTNNADGFALESNTNLAGTNWVAVSPPPLQVGANFTVTNTITPSEKFYRLRK